MKEHSPSGSRWSLSSELPPLVNGVVVIGGILFWIVSDLAQFRAIGAREAAKTVAIWTGALAVLAATCAGFILVRRATQAALSRWVPVTAWLAIALWIFAFAALVTWAASGPDAYRRLTIDAWLVAKNVTLFVLGVAMIGGLVLRQVQDTTLRMSVLVVLALIALAAGMMAILLAGLLPAGGLAALVIVIVIAIGFAVWRYHDVAEGIALLAALLGPFIFLHGVKGPAFWILIAAAMPAWIATYERYGDEGEESRWWAITQYISWGIVTAAEVYILSL